MHSHWKLKQTTNKIVLFQNLDLVIFFISIFSDVCLCSFSSILFLFLTWIFHYVCEKKSHRVSQALRYTI